MGVRQAADNFQAVAFARADIVVTAAGGGAFCRHQRLRADQRFIRINDQIDQITRRCFPANLQQQRLILRRSDGHIRNTCARQPHRLRLPALLARLRRIHQRPGGVKRLQQHRASATHQGQCHCRCGLWQGYRRLQKAVETHKFPPPFNARIGHRRAAAPACENSLFIRDRIGTFTVRLHFHKIDASHDRFRAGRARLCARVGRAQTCLHACLNIKGERASRNDYLIPLRRQTIPLCHLYLPGGAIHAADGRAADHAPPMQGAVMLAQPFAHVILTQVKVGCG